MHENWRRECYELKVAKRYDEALAVVRAAIEAGHLAANVALARMGDEAGLWRDEVDRIIEYVETSMDQNDIEAHLELRSAYDIGLGNIPYEEKAVRRFRHHLKAGELGAGPIVSIALARIYRVGAIAVEPDQTEAIRWYKRAIEQGSVEAAHELQDLYKQQEKAAGKRHGKPGSR
jgi:TPR repeat protein